MHIHVLGSGAGGGFPQWNCNCRNCDGVRKGTLRAQRRTQSSICVSADGVGWVLFNASPDILKQIQDFAPLQPGRAIRDTGIAGIVLIDAQIDHTTGLLMLREGKLKREIYCTQMVKDDLSSGNPLFHILGHYCGVSWHEVAIDGSRFEVPGAPGLALSAVALKSKAPPYSPHRHDGHPGDTIGVLVEDTNNGKRLFYAPGLGEIEPHLPALMARADCILVDGTFWTDREMLELGLMDRTSREIGHLPQSGPGGMLEVLAQYPDKRRVLIHINNTNPILDESSAERREVEARGVEIAYDGMDIVL
jgi:pyrroloquinoline quinone biosynthesis protein B